MSAPLFYNKWHSTFVDRIKGAFTQFYVKASELQLK